MARAEAVLNFRVPADPEVSRIVREGTSDFARSQRVGEDDLNHFLTALGEAVANAVEHARAQQPIAVHVRLEEDLIVACVEDDGVGFPSDALMFAPELPPLDAERGWGLAIMRRCSDIFNVKSAPGTGTSIVLGRYLRERTVSQRSVGNAKSGTANVA